MNVVNPLIYWAFAAVLVPILIHFFGRKARKSTLIPSLMWMKELKTSQRRKRWIKDWLVLSFRVLTIIFVVVALLQWKDQRTSTNLVIDHHPAGWETQWYTSAVEQLQPGYYSVYLKDGSYLGEWEKSAIPEVLSEIQPEASAWQRISDALVLSYGFDTIVSHNAPVYLPKRKVLENIPITVELNDQQFTAFTPLTQKIHWTIYKGDEIFSDQTSSVISLSVASVGVDDTFKIEALGDSVFYDNNTLLYRKQSPKTAVVVNKGASSWSGHQVDVDTVIGSNELDAEFLSSYGIVVLEGLDFLPEVLREYTGTVLQFYPQTTAPTSPSLPELEQNFFSDYFFGPSLQNAWPLAASAVGFPDSLTPLLKDPQGNTISGLYSTNSFKYYLQSSFPVEKEHPFYKAIFQWAGSNAGIGMISNPYLGVDQYRKNTTYEQVQFFELDASFTALHQGFWTREKIALALALLSALLALIFAKI